MSVALILEAGKGINRRVIGITCSQMHILKNRCCVYSPNMPLFQEKQGLKFNILYVILKKTHKTTGGDFLYFSFHTQKCADKN